MRQIFQDNEGALSSMRVVMVFVVVTFTIVWAILSIRHNELIVPDTKLLGVLGLVISGKVAQSFSENKSPYHDADGPIQPPNPGARS